MEYEHVEKVIFLHSEIGKMKPYQHYSSLQNDSLFLDSLLSHHSESEK